MTPVKISLHLIECISYSVSVHSMMVSLIKITCMNEYDVCYWSHPLTSKTERVACSSGLMNFELKMVLYEFFCLQFTYPGHYWSWLPWSSVSGISKPSICCWCEKRDHGQDCSSNWRTNYLLQWQKGSALFRHESFWIHLQMKLCVISLLWSISMSYMLRAIHVHWIGFFGCAFVLQFFSHVVRHFSALDWAFF